MTPTLIGGRYELHDEIAAGGMATVHIGRLVGAVGFSRFVAIKRLHPHFAKAPEFLTMLTDEARIAARIHHPNVVTTLDTVSEDGELYLVMELVMGEALAKLGKTTAAAGKKIPIDVGVGILVGALHGLEAAHEATNEHGEHLGVVHRDVSPQNILVGTDGVARVLDFGVAKALGRLQTTHEGNIKGKTAYMAPEQLRGKAADRRCDVFAAAVVLWQTLTGRPLFHGDSPGEVMARVLEQPIDPPSQHGPEISKALDEIVLRGLERDPDARWATAEEMANALEAAVTVPNARTIGRWVSGVAVERLALQAKLVAHIDRSSQSSLTRASLSTAGPTSPLPPAESMLGATPVAMPAPVAAPQKPSGSRARWVAGALALVVASLAGTAFAVVASRKAKAPAPSLTTPAVPEIAPPSTSAAPTPAATPIDGAARPEADPDAGTTPKTTKPQVAAKKAPAPAGGGAKKASCNPPYTVDSDGVHIPKKECR
jgi:serine/threonine-protein kinase